MTKTTTTFIAMMTGMCLSSPVLAAPQCKVLSQNAASEVWAATPANLKTTSLMAGGTYFKFGDDKAYLYCLSNYGHGGNKVPSCYICSK
jgi:hypothetical protein